MARYTLAKIDVTAIQPNPCYNWQHEYDTWAELLADLAHREQYANECFHGKGAHVLQNDTNIGNCRVFNMIDKPLRQVTLAEFKVAVAEDAA